MKKFLAILTVCALAGIASAGIIEDNSGLDAFWTGNWSDAGSNFPGWADNLDPDAWLASNGQKMVKDPADGVGTTEAAGWASLYRGAVGDTVAATYSFTAPSAITEQGWIIKAVVNRVDGRDSALRLSVQVNGGGFTKVDASSVFYSGTASGDIFISDPASGYGIDGPTETRFADLSALGIQAGDAVDYRITYDYASRHIGLGAQFIPEPATMALLGLGGLGVLLRRRRS